MSRRKTDLGTTASPQYTKSYGNIRGVDLSSDPSEVAEYRAAKLVNMYRDYDSEHGAAIETIPGFRRLFDFGGKVHGIWGYSSSQDEEQEEYIIVHAGRKLFAFKLSERDSGVYEECFEGLADRKSSAFLQNNRFYICDGEGIYILFPDGEEEGKNFKVLSLEEAAYVPITYISGAPYEQRNMLTDSFINRDTAVATERYDYEVRGYTGGDWTQYSEWIEKNDIKYNTVSQGYNHYYYVYHMSYSRTLDEMDVREIQCSYYNFGSGDDGVTYYFEITKELIEEYLEKSGLKKLKRLICTNEVSSEIKSLVEECYEGENSPMQDMYCADVVISDPCIELKKVTVAGVEIPEYKTAVADGGEKPDIFYMPVREQLTIDGEKKWYISFIHIYSKEQVDLNTQEIDIYGVAEEVKVRKVAAALKHTDYLNANTEYKGTSKEAILGCSIAATFDGRVFLTGNSKLPNTVFYSCRDLTGYNNPAYYGVYNYFNDGTDNSPNVALLATSSVLMVMKENTLHGSSIYYHTAADGLDDVVPRIYPSTPGVAGIGCVGEAINFLDDAVFLSDRGVEGVSKQTLNLERTIGHRSSNIDRHLRGSGGNILKDSRLCRWGGYLCLFLFNSMGGIFLGDSRAVFGGVDGTAEYEWFYLEGVCCYENSRERFRTLTCYPEINGYTTAEIPETADMAVADESEYVDFDDVKQKNITFDGAEVCLYYVERDGKSILCDSDGELEGYGFMYPACVGYSAHGTLFFGTTGGQVCCFNTDKRGQAYGEEYVDSDTVHRHWYSFDGRRYSSFFALKSDNCGVPHLTKRTVRKTCVLKLKAMQGSKLDVLVRTDREPYEKVESSLTGTVFNFDDIDFANFTFATEPEKIVTVKEKKKKWVEKQFSFESEGYKAPFGFYSLTYNYEIQGRVKK